VNDTDLAALRARHGQWVISVSQRGYLVAVRGGTTIITEQPARLEEAISEHESGRAAR